MSRAAGTTEQGDAPPGVAARFAHHPPGADCVAGGGTLLIATLLEEGDSTELAWLVRRLGEDELARWLERRGGRQLSRRSRAFWELVLGRRSSVPPPLAGELWPL